MRQPMIPLDLDDDAPIEPVALAPIIDLAAYRFRRAAALMGFEATFEID